MISSYVHQVIVHELDYSNTTLGCTSNLGYIEVKKGRWLNRP